MPRDANTLDRALLYGRLDDRCGILLKAALFGCLQGR